MLSCCQDQEGREEMDLLLLEMVHAAVPFALHYHFSL